MKTKYRKLTFSDRKALEMMCKAEISVSIEEMAAILGINRAGIYKELIKGGGGKGKRKNYSAEKAQKAANQ